MCVILSALYQEVHDADLSLVMFLLFRKYTQKCLRVNKNNLFSSGSKIIWREDDDVNVTKH